MAPCTFGFLYSIKTFAYFYFIVVVVVVMLVFSHFTRVNTVGCIAWLKCTWKCAQHAPDTAQMYSSSNGGNNGCTCKSKYVLLKLMCTFRCNAFQAAHCLALRSVTLVCGLHRKKKRIKWMDGRINRWMVGWVWVRAASVDCLVWNSAVAMWEE